MAGVFWEREPQRLKGALAALLRQKADKHCASARGLSWCRDVPEVPSQDFWVAFFPSAVFFHRLIPSPCITEAFPFHCRAPWALSPVLSGRVLSPALTYARLTSPSLLGVLAFSLVRVLGGFLAASQLAERYAEQRLKSLT